MKTKLLFSFLLLSAISGFAQTTMMTSRDLIANGIGSAYYGIPYPVNNIGPRDGAVAPDGTYWFVGKQGGISSDNNMYTYRTSPDGFTDLGVSVLNGVGPTLSNSYMTEINPTSDSGFVTFQGHFHFSCCNYHCTYLMKYAADGTLNWVDSLNGYDDGSFPGVSYFCSGFFESVTSNYYAVINDTLFVYDQAGNRFDTIPLPFNYSTIFYDIYQATELANGDLLLLHGGGDSLSRVTIAGSIVWSYNITTSSFPGVTNNDDYAFVYQNSGGTLISQIDLNTGSQMWQSTNPYDTVTDASVTDDGGLILSFRNMSLPSSGFLVKTDSSANVVWIKDIPLAHFGLTMAAETPDHGFLTGGCYHHCVFGWNEVYADFELKTDSLGYSVADQTTILWPGDANGDLTIDLNDALYVGIAYGSTGTPRLYEYTTFYNNYNTEMPSIDWGVAFANGSDYKHADIVADGIIDQLDLDTAWMFFPMVMPPFCRLMDDGGKVRFTNPVLRIVADDIPVDDDGLVTCHVIAGDANVLVDSIYGIAFNLSYGNIFSYGSINSFTLDNQSFGIEGVNLFQKSKALGLSFIVCRTDHQNVFGFADTIGTFTIDLNNAPLGDYAIDFGDVYALTYQQDPITFTVIGDTVSVDELTGVHGNNEELIQVFPNPASSQLFIRSHSEKISVMNILGEEVFAKTNPAFEEMINTQNFAEGVYLVSIQTESETITRFIEVIH